MILQNNDKNAGIHIVIIITLCLALSFNKIFSLDYTLFNVFNCPIIICIL